MKNRIDPVPDNRVLVLSLILSFNKSYILTSGNNKQILLLLCVVDACDDILKVLKGIY